MTRKEMWDEFENQLKREIHTPITMSYADSIRLAELGIEETVARWKQRLEQDTCEDCISRQAVIERINNAEENFKADNMDSITSDDGDPFVDGVLSGIFNIRQMVIQAPSVTLEQEQKTGWIPVSERLPEESGFYLATIDGELCGQKEPFSGMAEFDNGKWVDDEPDYQCIIAWMPLPEPYKEDK